MIRGFSLFTWRMNVIAMKRIILTLGTLGLLTLASCSSTPGAHGVKNRIESQKRVAGHAARLELEQAYRAYSTGMFDQAMKYAEQARLRTPQDPSAYMIMARICLEQGRLESSDKLIGQALTLDPSIPDAHYLRGVIYQRWSRDEQALDAYMSAWNVDPNSVQSVHYLLAAGEVLVDMKRYRMARELLIPKLGYFENNAAMHHLLGTIAVLEENGELAIEHLSQAYLIGGEDEIILADLARAQLDHKQYRECLRNLEVLENILAESVPGWLFELRARCYKAMGSPRDARSSYVQLLRIEPDNVDAWIEYGDMAHQIGDFVRLDTCGGRLISIAPDRFEGYFYKGIVYLNAEKLESAQIWFSKAVEVAPQGQSIPSLAVAHVEMLRGDRMAARHAFKDVLRRSPNDPRTRSYMETIATGSLDFIPE
ncbi:MAG TPA: hypothetical protein DCX60_11310 [Phycisphaerales bacterium]|nr:hypothetical protein [Phycisphaerales bacterium]